MKRFCLALLTLPMFSSPAFADVVHLKNGPKTEGLIIEYCANSPLNAATRIN